MMHFTPATECPYLVTFLKINSFLYLTPFAISRCPKTRHFQFHSTRLRKVICGFLHLIIIGTVSVTLATNIWSYLAIRHDITTTFGIVYQVTPVMCTIILKLAYWTKQEQLHTLISLTSLTRSSSPPERTTKAKLLTASLWISSAAVSGIYGRIVQQHVSDILNKTIYPEHNDSQSELLVALKCFATILFRLVYIIEGTVLPWELVLAFSVRMKVTDELVSDISHPYGNVPKMIQSFHKMQELTRVTRSAFGNYILAFHISVLSYFTTLPQLVVSQVDLLTRTLTAFYMIVLCYSHGVAASVNSLMEDSLRTYIYNQQLDEGTYCSTAERLQLVVINTAIESHSMGISCSFFTITRDFLSSTLSLIVTFGIVMLQVADKEKVFWELDQKN